MFKLKRILKEISHLNRFYLSREEKKIIKEYKVNSFTFRKLKYEYSLTDYVLVVNTGREDKWTN